MKHINWFKLIRNGLFTYVVVVVFFIVSAELALTVLPSTYWIEYEKVIPTKDTFQIGEKLQFVSVSEVYRPTEVRWNDVLRCDFGQGFGHFSDYQSSSLVGVRELSTTSPWTYNGVIPNEPTSCFLESHIFAGRGEQTIIGNVFKIQ